VRAFGTITKLKSGFTGPGIDSVLEGHTVFGFVRFNAAERGECMRKKVPHRLSPDLSGRVCGTAAGIRFAREAEGQIEVGLSFASFYLAVKVLFSRHSCKMKKK